MDAIARTITGQAGDPIADFRITVPANQRSANLNGFEFNVQHMFGASGFGVSANYTLVNSGLKYNNQVRGEQFALEGLSDAANVVGFYENYGWSVRLAYNWRDDYLIGLSAAATGIYNSPYTDLSATLRYDFTSNVSLGVEALNLLDEKQRTYDGVDEALRTNLFFGRIYKASVSLKF